MSKFLIRLMDKNNKIIEGLHSQVKQELVKGDYISFCKDNNITFDVSEIIRDKYFERDFFKLEIYNNSLQKFKLIFKFYDYKFYVRFLEDSGDYFENKISIKKLSKELPDILYNFFKYSIKK